MLSVLNISAQFSIRGSLAGEKGAVPDGIVQLLRGKDSSLVKIEITAADGTFTFNPVPPGNYFLSVGVDLQKELTAPFDLKGDTILPAIMFRKSEMGLQEVAVVARKQYIEREQGKVILNVENSINAEGSSAYEILEKAPGVRIDNNDNITVNGKGGAMIWIDGKPSPMSGADLANYLRGLPSSAIEKVEIISNPPAKYDAAGSSIINIRMKKDKRIGTNGSITSSYIQGIYPKTNNSLSLNHRNKKVNVFGSYNYAYREAFSHLQLDRSFYKGDSLLGAFVQDNMLLFDFNTHVARAGIDWYASRKDIFGVLVSGVDNRFNPTGDNVSRVFDGRSQTSVFTTSNRSHDHWHNYSANMNYKHTFDSTGTEFTADADYAHYGNRTQQNFTTKYFDLADNQIMQPYLLYGNLSGNLDLYSLKSDFVKNYTEDLRLEGGQKSSYVIADNDLQFFDRSDGVLTFDSTKSNRFIYTENINAAYVSGSYNRKKWSYRLGIRAEHTYVTGEQKVYAARFSRNYVQIFPNFFAGYKAGKKHAWEFNYSRRIRRPSYEQLNPFKFYLDPTTYKEGNPYLQPSVTESFEFTHILLEKISTTLGFGRTFDNIIEVIAPLAGSPKVTVQTERNLRMVDVYALNISAPADLKKWWSLNTDVNLYHARYYGNIANTPLNGAGNLNFNLNAINTFTLSKTMTSEFTFNYRTREVYAYDIIEPIWFVNIGFQKKFLSNMLILRLNANDVFYTNRIRADVDYTGYAEHFDVRRDTRQVTVSVTYKFGKNTVGAARRRLGGAEDIKERAGTG